MAQTSVELRKLLQLNNFNLFDFQYEFNDLKMKEKIEHSLTDYYSTYEINGDTVEEFKFRFKRRYLNIIDFYNDLHNTTLFDYNPFVNNKTVETTRQVNTGQADTISSSETANNSTTSNNNKNSDYPQQNITVGNYLSAEQENSSTSTDSSTSGNTSKNIASSNIEFERKVESLTGITYQDLIQKERKNLINIIDMVITEMKPCFIMVY